MPFRPLLAVLLAVALLGLVACGEEESGLGEGQEKAAEKEKAPADASAGEGNGAKTSAAAAKRTKPKIDVPQGQAPGRLEVKDLEKGTGPTVKAGDQIAVNYSGVLYKNGKEFDNSFDRGEPFQFQLHQLLERRFVVGK